MIGEGGRTGSEHNATVEMRETRLIVARGRTDGGERGTEGREGGLRVVRGRIEGGEK